MEEISYTPVIQQYLRIKKKYHDCIIFFRMGDFYEMFFDDAILASKLLNITLTFRGKNKDQKKNIPFCGVPFHSAIPYISKIIKNGLKVALCEQIKKNQEKISKGIIERKVVKIITPGLMIDLNNLESKENNFIASIALKEKKYGLAFIDISTGEFKVLEIENQNLFLYEVFSFDFREILISQKLKQSKLYENLIKENITIISIIPDFYFSDKNYINSTIFKEINQQQYPAAFSAVKAIYLYVKETQMTQLKHITYLQWIENERYLYINEKAKKDLELFKTISSGQNHGSLLKILDNTISSMGGRCLRWWLHYPLRNEQEIKERLNAVSEIKDQYLLRKELQNLLNKLHDIERLGGRIAMHLANARDLLALKNSLLVICSIKNLIKGLGTKFNRKIYRSLIEMEEIIKLISLSIDDIAVSSLHDGGIIKKGFNEELDKLIDISCNCQNYIALLEAKEKSRTGIKNLKIRYNSVFGYYIEVTKSNYSLVPKNYIRRQTLTNVERYINQELKEYEDKITLAEIKRKEKEFEIFCEIRKKIASQIVNLQKISSAIAKIDVIQSFAEIAEINNYCLPIIEQSAMIELSGSRHPVLEQMKLNSETFIPNNLLIDGNENRFIILTGPNMAGKSTYMRQVALTIIMAQIGSFVPAFQARIGIVDKIFTRIGTNDNIAYGQSTFMVEMNEIANIVNNATSMSFILLDEVGRGTSTFDGMSLAWSIVEYFYFKGIRTLFSTHYHELTRLVENKKGMKNFHISIKECGKEIIFLHKIIEGISNKSYGIQVAKIAGIPMEIINRASILLSYLEQDNKEKLFVVDEECCTLQEKKQIVNSNNSSTINYKSILNELLMLDLINLTPLNAIILLNKWKKKLFQKS